MQSCPNFEPEKLRVSDVTDTMIFNMIIKCNAAAVKNIFLISTYIVKLFQRRITQDKNILPN